MVSPKNRKPKFDFSDIYPNCVEGYNWSFLSNYEPVADKLTTLCSFFKNDEMYGSCNSNFIQRCQLVTYYLQYIKNKGKNNNSNACCIYFYYKLKDLLSNYGCKCDNLKNCYDKMESLSKNSELVEKISSLFSQCNDYPHLLDDNNFLLIFKTIDKTYLNLKEFIRYQNPGYWKYVDFRKGIKYLENHQNNYHSSFKEVLKYFKDTCVTYVNQLNPTDSSVRPFLEYLIRDKNNGEYSFAEINAIIGTDDVVQIDAIADTAAQIDGIKGTDTGSQISTGICFLFFSILIIMFIMYKYTTFGSYIQPRARRLRKVMKRKNKKHMNLKDSYKNMYNELNDKQYEVVYRSI